MKLTVVGLGYIGLPTSIMFAKHGVDVLGVDINQQTIDKLQSGQISIEEPGLQEIYEEVLSSGKLENYLQRQKHLMFLSLPFRRRIMMISTGHVTFR